MKPSLQCDSGFVDSADLIASGSPEMRIVKVIRESDMSVTAMGERYGHRWFLKSIPDIDTSTVALQRLKKEFEIQSSLHHPGIASAVSLERVDGIGLCIISEWIEGKTLAEVLDEGKLTRSDRHRLSREIVDALSYIHSEGIVHRDLKPENIMIRKNGGSAVIVDFGLADTDSHTQLKAAAGTEGYMAPEAYTRHEADTRDDVYSSGVILMQLSCGNKAIIRRCLSSSHKRYENAGKLKEALNRQVKNRKIARYVGISLGLFVVLGAMIIEILSLKNENIDSVERIAVMQDSVGVLVKNAKANLQTISEMTDTITLLKENVSELSALQKKQQEIENVIETGINVSKAAYGKYDDKKIKEMLSEGKSKHDISVEAMNMAKISIDKYIEEQKKNFSQNILENIRKEIWDRTIHIQNNWLNTLYKDGSN